MNTSKTSWVENSSSQDDYSRQLECHLLVEQLFVNPDNIDVEVCAISKSGYKAERFQTIEALEIYLHELDDLYSANNTHMVTQHLFFLHQLTSRSRLCISKGAFSLLLAHLQIPTSFLNITTPFGREDGAFTDGCSNFYALAEERVSGPQVFHTAYILKHVEAHDRSGTEIPWSIRQMAIYQKHEVSTKAHSGLLIQTSINAQREISALMKKGDMAEFQEHWTYLHEIYAKTVIRNWASYIKLLDRKVSQIDLEVSFSNLGNDSFSRVTFEDLKRLNQYTNLLVRIQHALNQNLEVLGMLTQEAIQRRVSEGDPDSMRYTRFQNVVRICVSEHIFLKHHADLVREGADRLAVQLRDTITLQDSNLMLTLTTKTISETRTMKTITFIALLYLPASFTSSFFGMGLLHVESLSGILRVSASQDMWFYFAITVPLMLVTTIGWWLWEVVVQRKERRRLMGERTGKSSQV